MSIKYKIAALVDCERHNIVSNQITAFGEHIPKLTYVSPRQKTSTVLLYMIEGMYKLDWRGPVRVCLASV